MKRARLFVPFLTLFLLSACGQQELVDYTPSVPDSPAVPAVDTVSTVDPLPIQDNTLYIYTLRKPKGTIAAYDEAMAATTIQGILNRECGPILYIQSQAMGMPQYWLEILSTDGWLAGRTQVRLETFDDLMALAINKVNRCVIWDPSVPATVNVATTIVKEYDDGTMPDYHKVSHGESFLEFLSGSERRGLYLMDEPEAALSPQRQLSLLIYIARMAAAGSQFIIATHSPILLGTPDAEILEFSSDGIRPCAYEDTESYSVTRLFLENRERMLRELLDDHES